MDTLSDILGKPTSDLLTGGAVRREFIPGQSMIEPLSPVEPAPSLESQIAMNMVDFFNHPWAMIEKQAIFTNDEVDLIHPVKPFPADPWLKPIIDLWMQEPLFAIYKSRRMMMTWLMVFLHLWLAMFREGAAIFFVADKEEKSDALVKRATFMYNSIPDTMMLKPKAVPSYCNLKFPGLNSYIKGIPQGSDQLRLYTATAILNDEFAHWDHNRETFMASKPTIDGGGRVTCISSPKMGFFKELCFDQVR